MAEANFAKRKLKEWFDSPKAPPSVDAAPRVAEDYGVALPGKYYIDTGNICNLECPFCPTGIGNKALTKGFMSRESFDIIFEQIKPYAKIVGLYNWGEPFLNKHMLYMASTCAENGIQSQIDSNLTLRDFTDAEADDIVRSGLFQIYASIDGASQESYEKYRVGGDFNRAVNNVRQIVNAKKRLKMDTPHIGWNFLINKHNEHEIEEAKQMAKEIGVRIDVKLMSCWDPSWKSSFHTQADEAAVSENQEPFRQASLPQPIEQLKLHPGLKPWCMQPFDFMVINWDGNVMPCCTVFGNEYTLGNLLKESVEDVWNNAQLRSCRKFLYNFGPKQDTESICEKLPCPVQEKYLPSLVEG